MIRIILHGRGNFDEWRDAARDLLRHGMAPRDVDWCGGRDSCLAGLFDPPQAVRSKTRDRPLIVTPRFLDLAQDVIRHSDPGRFDLAYRLLWRLQDEPRLLDVATDADVVRAHLMVRAVHRDGHKMRAFVRFRELARDNHAPETVRRRFVAWFEPDHFVVAREAGFFRRRFADMDWAILTPRGAAMWDGEQLRISDEAAEQPDLQDETDELWRTYFANIFNPARLKIKMMQTEMPKKYWKNLPEAELIPGLINSAEQRVRDMAERPATEAPAFHDRLTARR